MTLRNVKREIWIFIIFMQLFIQRYHVMKFYLVKVTN